METLGHGDIFETDPAEGGLQEFDCPNDLRRIFGSESDRHRIHAAQILEEQRLAFHDRQSCFRADVTQAKDLVPSETTAMEFALLVCSYTSSGCR